MYIVLKSVRYCKDNCVDTYALDCWLLALAMISVAGMYSTRTYRSEVEEVVELEFNRTTANVSSDIFKVPSLPLVSYLLEGAHAMFQR